MIEPILTHFPGPPPHEAWRATVPGNVMLGEFWAETREEARQSR